jgi:hypothetical protein
LNTGSQFARGHASIPFVCGVLVGVVLVAGVLECLVRWGEASLEKALTAVLEPWGMSAESIPSGNVTALGWWVHAPAEQAWWKLHDISDRFAGQIAWPGYPPFWRTDAELRSELESFPFDYSIRMQSHSDRFYFLGSSEGCLSVVRRYGADLLLMGNCEGYRSINPFSFRFPQEQKRVLTCFRNESDFAFAQRVLETLEGIAPALRPQQVVWSFSLWQLSQAEQAEQAVEVAPRPSRAPTSPLQAFTRRWASILKRHPFNESRVFTSSELESSALLLRKNEFWFRSAVAYPGKDCGTRSTINQFSLLEYALRRFRRMGIQVVLSVAPHLPEKLGFSSECGADWLRRIERLEKSGLARVVTADSAQKLSWSDYLFPLSGSGESLLMPSHLNAQGANRWTATIEGRLF